MPPGMPPLYPTTIVITQDGTPLAGATVVAVSEDFASTPYPSGGTTDKSGEVVLKTNGKFSGIPAGKYIITVSKIGSDIEIASDAGSTLDAEEYEKLVAKRDANSFYLTEEKFANQGTSPLRIEVNKGVKTHSLDVSPKVHIKIINSPPA
ncbi:hypothetical protein FACS1894170_05860 [Planctomycetales bacterium]|nr:hypothetical protein FACS1894170_05860 [Planctomycetales bacterium]